MNPDDVIKQVNLLEEQLHNCRACFPYMTPHMIGRTTFCTAPFYQKRGFTIQFQVSQPVTADDIDRLNSLGSFINESYVVMLCALLESHQVLQQCTPVDRSLCGSDKVHILRSLRNKLAHTAGRYNPDDDKSKKLYEKIVSHFKLEAAEDATAATRFPTDIQEVLEPMTRACREYVKAFCGKSNVGHRTNSLGEPKPCRK